MTETGIGNPKNLLTLRQEPNISRDMLVLIAWMP